MIFLTRAVAFLTLFFLAFNANANTLRIGVDAIGENFDYRYTLDANAYRVIKLLSTNLLKNVDEDIPVAKIIKQSGKSITFKINKNTFFTNGDQLTAIDIKNMYHDLMHNPKISVYASTLENIKSIDIIDNFTIKFNFKNHDNFPTAKFTIPIFKNVDSKLIGLGPYVIDEFKFPYKLTLKAVDKNLHYQKLEFIPNSLPVVRIIKLMKGEVDVLHGALQADQINLLKQKNFNVFSSIGSNYSYLGFNLQDQKLKDKKLRQALAYAIDVDSVIKYLNKGYAKKAGSLLSPSHPYYKANYLTYNPTKSIKLLEELGYKKNKNGFYLEIDFSISNNNQSLRYSQILQDQLKQVGIKVNIKTSDWGRFYNDIKEGNFQMYALGWVGIFDGDIYKELFHSKSIGEQGLNRSYYKSKQMDMLIDKIMTENLTNKDFKNTVFAIQDLQFNDMIYIPLWRGNNTVISNSNIKAYEPSLDGGFEAIKHLLKEK